MFLFPINRDKRPERTPCVTYGLIAANSLIWAGLAVSGLQETAIQNYGFRPAHMTLLTLWTSMFLHAGLLHVAGNMWFLWMFGPKVEDRLGSLEYLVAYLICGAGAVGVFSLFSLRSMVPLVGASGAISGVAGMYFLLFPKSPFELVLFFGWWIRKSFRVWTRGAVGAWIGEQVVLGLISSATGGETGVAFWAHVGGFATGLAVAALLVNGAPKQEVEAILHPGKIDAGEWGDLQEQESSLTTLKLGK